MSDAHPTSTTAGQRGAPRVDASRSVGPPSKHQLALMIWIAVFPTLTVINLAVGPWLADLNVVLRTLILVTVAVPIVIYAVMPRLHRVRARILTRRPA
jgi:antibiotic biosynthesis monooxygenase (ABM) superfamily enzyme